VNYLKVLGARKLTQRTFNTEDPQIWNTTVQNS